MTRRTRCVRPLLCLFPAFALLALAGCDGGNGGNSGNTIGASKTPVGLTLSPATDFLKIGQTESFSAQARMSDGSTQTVTAAWVSDAPHVAAFESGGLVRGVSPGDATISADYQGLRATQRLRVAPDYQGTWSGGYRNLSCSATGAWAEEDMCNELDWVGPSWDIGLRLLQTRTSVTGTLRMGDMMGDVSGEIGVGGNLVVTGSWSYEEEGIRWTCAMADWNTMAEGDRMTGTFTEVWTVADVSGEMRLPSAMETVQRVSTSSERTLDAAEAGAPAGGKPLQKLRRLTGARR